MVLTTVWVVVYWLGIIVGLFGWFYGECFLTRYNVYALLRVVGLVLIGEFGCLLLVWLFVINV